VVSGGGAKLSVLAKKGDFTTVLGGFYTQRRKVVGVGTRARVTAHQR
jgi:hypothetical protein